MKAENARLELVRIEREKQRKALLEQQRLQREREEKRRVEEQKMIELKRKQQESIRLAGEARIEQIRI